MSTNSNNTNYREVFSNRLSKLMEDRNTTQETLAKYCYVSRQSVAKWASGSTTPDIDNLARIADFFNVSTDYLVGRTDYETTNQATKELCSTLGLSDRSIDFLRKDIPLYFEEWEKGCDCYCPLEVAYTVLVLDALLEDHIDYLTNKDNRKTEDKHSLIQLLRCYFDHIALSGSATLFSNHQSLLIDNIAENITINQDIGNEMIFETLYNIKDLLIAQDIQKIVAFLQMQDFKGIDRETRRERLDRIGGDKK